VVQEPARAEAALQAISLHFQARAVGQEVRALAVRCSRLRLQEQKLSLLGTYR
jgi:hypothetical protein